MYYLNYFYVGESVLSLLIVELSSEIAAFYFTFYVGVVSVTFLQYLYFRSQPHHPKEHAMKRKRIAGIIFLNTAQYYSAALILVGVSFKLLLTEFNYETDEGSTDHHRLLAGGTTSKYPMSERRLRIAIFFCVSLGVSFLALEIMTLAHKGTTAIFDQYRNAEKISSRIIGILLVLSRLLIIVFISTVFLYTRNPEIVALLGFVSVFSQVVTRLVGGVFFPPKGKKSEGDDENPKSETSDDTNENFEDEGI